MKRVRVHRVDELFIRIPLARALTWRGGPRALRTFVTLRATPVTVCMAGFCMAGAAGNIPD